MFQTSEQFDTDFRLTLLFCPFNIYDPETGLYLSSSSGRRRHGRPTRYYVSSVRPNYFECQKPFPTPRTMFWVERFGDTYRELPRLQAYSEAEAVEKANRWVAEAAPDLSVESARALRDVLPATDFAEFEKARAGKMSDAVVLREYREGGGDAWKPWPGSHGGVSTWWVLANGHAVGRSERRSKGVYFPVVSLVS